MPPTAATEAIVHGTAVARDGRAALLRGPAGAGKSDLALRAMSLCACGPAGPPLALVADDQVHVARAGADLFVAPPPQLAGLLEVRGLGIRTVPYCASARLALIVDLVPPEAVERFPDPWPFEALLGVSLPLLRLCAFEDSAPLKLALALSTEPWREGEG